MNNDPYQVNTVICSTWGDDQTNNVDFYRIVRRTRITVWLEPLRSRRVNPKRWTAETVEPTDDVKEIGAVEVGSKGDKWDGEPIRRKLRISENGSVRGLQIRLGWARIWDGKPRRQSRYVGDD